MQNNYNISVTANPLAGGNVEGYGSYNCGEIATIRAIPNECYLFIHWTENGEVFTENPYIFEVGKNRNLVAHFEIAKYEITLRADPPTGGYLTGAGIYDCGNTVTVKATPDIVYYFEKWTTEDGTWVSDDAEYDFILTNNTSLVAHFTQSHYRITILANDTLYGITEPEGTILYEIGSTVSLKAREKECYSFLNWTTNDGKVLSTDIIYEFVATKDTTLIPISLF